VSDVCLSVVYIGPKSRTERPRKTKIGTEVGHIPRDSDFQGQKVKGRLQGVGCIVAASCTVCYNWNRMLWGYDIAKHCNVDGPMIVVPSVS